MSAYHFLSVANNPMLSLRTNLLTYPVYLPTAEYSFTHETAIFAHNGMIFAAWYNNGKVELQGETPIFWCCWKPGDTALPKKKLLATDPTAEILYCPPVFGECDGKLYLLINEMYRKPDHIHALDLYQYNEDTMEFEFLWSQPIPFKLNTNVCRTDQGKLILPGRIAELDGFPNTPAVLISDSGKINADWRLVKLAENGNLPEGGAYVHPELTLLMHGADITAYCRKDMPDVIPLFYQSHDYGETWSEPICHDLPLSDSKIYTGTLSDGRDYLIANLYPGRTRLAFYYTNPGDRVFTHGFLLQNGASPQFPGSGLQWSYPSAHEYDGTLYVIYTASLSPDHQAYRGAVVTEIPLDTL